jgi:hypothetical protein
MHCPRPLNRANSGWGAGPLKIRVVRPSVLDRNDRKDHNGHNGRQQVEQLSITGTAQATVVQLSTGTGVAILCASGIGLSPGS